MIRNHSKLWICTFDSLVFFVLASYGLTVVNGVLIPSMVCSVYVIDVGWVCRCALQIAGSSSWHARYTVLTYLQIMVFYNLFTFMSDQKALNDVRALVIQLLEDEQLEVKSQLSLITV